MNFSKLPLFSLLTAAVVQGQTLTQIGTSRFSTDSTARNWFDCKAKAAEYGLSFASVHSNAERDAIHAYFTSHVWSGGYRTGLGASFAWDDGTAWDYAPWHSGQPDNAWGGQDGVLINWLNQKNMADEARTFSLPCVFSDPIPAQQIGTSRFYTDDSMRTWDDCKTKAAEYGLTFASIHSDEERDAVIASGISRMWSGGYRTAAGQPFEWDDGTAWDYDAWSPGQPNNELVVVVNYPSDNLWHDWTGNNLVRCLFAGPFDTPLEGYDVQSDEATANPDENEINIATKFGVESYSAEIELMDQDCETYVGQLLTLESAPETVFTSGSFEVDTIIGVHPEHLEGTGNDNVLFPVGGEPITTRGEIRFCVKSHSTETTIDGNGGSIVVEMEVEKVRYIVQYDGSDTAFSTFSLDTDIVAEAIVTGATFEDGDLLEAGGLVFHRCTVDSTADSGDTSAAVEEEDFCLCIGPEENVGRVLSDINLNAVYGTSFDQTLPLVIDSGETLSVVSVEANAEGTKFTRLTVPILSEFIESGGTALRLSGDVDVGFAQNRRLQASGENETAKFEFVVELEGMKEVGCLGRIIARMNDIFF